MAKIQPAHLDLKFTLVTAGGAHTAYGDIDIARALSAVNRRLYRQGMMYYVRGVSLDVSPDQVPIASIVCQTAPDTWMTHNAWKKGFRVWKDQRNDATKAVGIPAGKWEDFKIDLDDNSSTRLETSCSDTGTVVPDEWALSQVFWDDDGTERSPTFCLLGATAVETKIGLVQEYHISRARPDAFNPDVDDDASDSIFAKMLPMQDELSDALLGDIEDDNDNPPYDLDQMVGGDTIADAPFDVAKTSVSYFSPVSQTDAFKVPCGLLRVLIGIFQADGSALTSGTLGVGFTVHLAAGPYKGVMAEPMGQ